MCDLGVEFRGREADARVRFQAIAGGGIAVEEALEGRRRLGVAPDAQAGLEHAELQRQDQQEGGKAAGAARGGGAALSVARPGHDG